MRRRQQRLQAMYHGSVGGSYTYAPFWSESDPEIRAVEAWHWREYQEQLNRPPPMRLKGVWGLIPPEKKEEAKGEAGLFPETLRRKKTFSLDELRDELHKTRRKERVTRSARIEFYRDLRDYLARKYVSGISITDLPLPEELNL